MRDQQKKGRLVSNDAQVFLAIANHPIVSIKVAAKACGVTQAAATHSLVRMEKRLGVKLVERRTALTEEGRRAVPFVEAMIVAEENLFIEFGASNVV